MAELLKPEGNQKGKLELSGNIKNLLGVDIVMMAGGVHSILVAGGGIKWRGSGKPEKLTTIGQLNGFFTLCETAGKISEAEAERVIERMPVRQYRRYEKCLCTGPRSKGKPMVYHVVSRKAAIVARDRCRDLRDLLVPVGGFHSDKKVFYVGFVPAWMLFEDAPTGQK